MITQQINISFSSAMADTIRIHTAETGRVIVFIPDVELEQDQSAEIIIVKPDNTFVIDDATISNGLIIVTIPEQAGAVSGVGGYILKIYKDSLCVYSASGPLMVDDHLLTDGMIESVAEVHGLVFPDDFLTDGDIVINPTTPAFATLTKIKYKGITYEVDGGAEDLNDLTDVTLTNPETGEVLTYDGEKWVNETLNIPEDLDDLNDVTIISPASRNVLQYDGTGWKNAALSIPDELSDLSDVAITSPAAGNVLTYNGAAWQNQNLTIPEDLDDLGDVEISAPSDGQQLVYNDGVWENQTITPVISKEATGNPIELTDAASAPIVKCVTEIVGSQDLHGYDKPWVGGAGKNKLNLDIATIKAKNTSGTWTGNTLVYLGRTFKINTLDGVSAYSIDISGAPSSGYPVLYTGDFSLPVGECIISFSRRIRLYKNNTLVLDVTTSPATFTVDNASDVYYVAIFPGGFEITYTEQPMIRLSTVTDSTFTPYSNICPITAYTENTISVGGDTGYDTSDFIPHSAGVTKTVESDGILFSANGSATYQDIAIGANNSLIVPPGTYTIEVDIVSVSDTSAESMFGLRKSNYSFIVPNIDSSSVGHKSLTVTTEESTYISMTLNGSPSSQNAIKIKNFKLINVEQQSTTYPSAIYRGSEDCVNGEVTTEWGMIASYAGETLPGEWISDRDEYAPGTTPTTGAQVAYALATPTSASVTPTNLPIRTLSGYNHIESTTGEMEVEYITQTYEPIIKAVEQLIPANTQSNIQSNIQRTIEETPQEIKKIVTEEEPEEEKEGGEEDADQRLTDE